MLSRWNDKAKRTKSAERSRKAEGTITKSDGGNGHAKHFWTMAEEEVYVNAVIELAPKYRGWTSDFYQAIADEVNKKCSHLKKDYVPLDVAKVKDKRSDSKRYLVCAPLLLVLSFVGLALFE
jgi:hypothetical protein